MTPIHRLEQHTNQPDDDRPDDVVIADLIKERDSYRDLVNSLRTENAQLQRAIKELEREGLYLPPVLYAPGEQGHQPAHTDESVW